MSYSLYTTNKSILDIKIFEKRLRETKVALKLLERQDNKNYNLKLIFDIIEKIKFLNIKIENKIKTKTQEALQIFF